MIDLSKFDLFEPKAKDTSCGVRDGGVTFVYHKNGKRIVFSNDGLIYYTEDHYESFELLYGEES